MDRAPAWKTTVEHWFELEASFGFTKRGKGLPTVSRPQAVAQWIKSYRNERSENIPKAVGKAEEFGAEVRKWWRAINPDWRTPSPDGTFFKNEEKEGSWEVLRVYGPNGFLSVLGCLVWWHQRAMEEKIIDESWFLVNIDVDHVLKKLLAVDGPALKKQRIA
ncbi:hypothetical protein EV360DRAFT_57114 [Lentinula raphanica]|nr:hypothetical protein EV360DRAFT_57114 [Lentinula raphanica]